MLSYLIISGLLTVPGCDRDNDGFTKSEDCDDSNPDIGDGTHDGDLENDWTNFCTPACDRTIQGDLILNTATSDDLESLSCIVEVQGHLKLNGNTSLTNLKGLEGLTHIGGDVEIVDSDSLLSLSGINHELTINGSLYIIANRNLSSISALDGLSRVGFLYIEYNPFLENLDGLGTLSDIGGSLLIENNLYLNDISALYKVDHVGGYLTVFNNTELCESDVERLIESIGENNIDHAIGYNGLKDC